MLDVLADADAVLDVSGLLDGADQVLALRPLAASCILSHEDVGILSQLTASEDDLLTVLWDSFGTTGATKTELKEAADMPKSTYYRTINALVDKGKVVRQQEGRSTRYTAAVHDDQLDTHQSHGVPVTAGHVVPSHHL